MNCFSVGLTLIKLMVDECGEILIIDYDGVDEWTVIAQEKARFMTVVDVDVAIVGIAIKVCVGAFYYFPGWR